MSNSKTQSAVLDYLSNQNRPFSANDIVTGLRGEHNKAAVQKTLDALVEEGKILDKLNGKQHIYLIDQSKMSTLSDSELKSMEAEVSTKRQELRQRLESVRRLELEYKHLTSAVTTEEARTQLTDANQKLAAANDRLCTIKSSGGVVVSPADRTKASKQLQQFVKEWRKRKALVSDMANTILESYPKSKREFYEEIGLEDDGDLKIPKI